LITQTEEPHSPLPPSHKFGYNGRDQSTLDLQRGRPSFPEESQLNDLPVTRESCAIVHDEIEKQTVEESSLPNFASTFKQHLKPPDNLFSVDYEEKPSRMFGSIISSASADLCDNDMSEGTGTITVAVTNSVA
jgi:hypothetical protein